MSEKKDKKKKDVEAEPKKEEEKKKEKKKEDDKKSEKGADKKKADDTAIKISKTKLEIPEATLTKTGREEEHEKHEKLEKPEPVSTVRRDGPIHGMQEAYKGKSEFLKMNLLKKKNQVLTQVEKLNFRIHEIHYAKNHIERDITAEFQAMLERLKQAEIAKVSHLVEDADELQQEILRIEDMLKNVDELTTLPIEPPEFLMRSRQIDQWVEFVMAKPMKIIPDVNPYDLPQELKIVREKLNQTASYQELLDFKDQVIHKLLKEKEIQESKLREEYEKKFQEELNEWSKLIDQFALELNKFKLVCFYDGAHLDITNINQPCLKNNSAELNQEGFSQDKPDPSVNGTQRHFWGRPKKVESPIKRTQLNVADLSKTKEFQIFLDVVIPKIKRELDRTQTNIDKLFVLHDKNYTGEIKPVPFQYILQEYCNLDPAETQKLVDLLNPDKKETIEYARFLNLLNIAVR